MWYKCMRCGHVHNVGDVEVTGHYSDCTMWRCPNCKANIDDRPIGWGGSAQRVDSPGEWSELDRWVDMNGYK